MDCQSLEDARQSVKPNTLKRQILAGKLAHSFSIMFVANVEVVFYAATAGYDAVLIDLEHGSFSLSSANQLCACALQAGITPMVRVPANTSEWISRALDGGAGAIVVPHINTAAEAENVVKYARFNPHGERSASATATPGLAILSYASIPAEYASVVANEAIMVICMIETVQALENVEAIAAVPGVDMLLVGSADLTADMETPRDFDSPRLAEAYAKVSAACEKASKDGRVVTMGMGGLGARPDLIERFARKHSDARYAMSGADKAMLLKAMVARGEICQRMTADLG